MDLYKNELITLLDKHAPSVTKSFKPQQSPWWNEKCQKAKTEMRRAQRRFRKNRNDETKLLFQEKLIDKAIIVNRARDLYFDGKLSSVKGDSKGTYRVINHLLDKEFSSTKLPNGNSDQEIAEDLKNYFHKKVADIYSEIEDGQTQLVDNPIAEYESNSPDTVADDHNYLHSFKESPLKFSTKSKPSNKA